MANHDALESKLAGYLGRSGQSAFFDLVEAARGSSRVITADSSLISSDGASQTVSVYEIDWTTGDVLIGGTLGTIAAGNDQDLLADVTAVDLAGAAPVALDDGDTYYVLVCAVIVNDVPALAFVFGDAAVDGSEVVPTAEQAREALRLGGIANHTASGLGIVCGTIKINRATTTITMTHSAATGAIKGGRLAGALD